MKACMILDYVSQDIDADNETLAALFEGESDYYVEEEANNIFACLPKETAVR